MALVFVKYFFGQVNFITVCRQKKSPQEMVIKEYSYGLILTFTGNIAT